MSQDNNNAIRVENLSKAYKLYNKPVDRMKESLHPFRKKYHHDFYALNDVSFEVKKGETVGIIGKNGSGKSTLLKVITGVLTPTSGSVQVNGKISALLELGAGFNPEFTGVENVYFNGSIMGYTRAEMSEKMDDILSFADIGEFAYQPVKIYSSGMFARLAFSLAINVEPEILIVDEALSVGDIAFQAKCYKKFQEYQKLGKTIIFVTHSVDLIIKYCHKAILLHNGVILKHDDSKQTVELFRKIMVNTDAARGFSENDQTVNENDEAVPKSEVLKSLLPVNPKPIVYGTFEAEIIDFGIINEENKVTNQIYHNEVYSVVMKIKFNKDILDPIFAYTIKNVHGLELTGTNSLNLNQVFGLIKSGEIVKVTFKQKMILNSGQYLLALGCTKFVNDNLTVYHRIYDAVAMDIVSSVMATGFAFADSILEYKSVLE